jgi:hypothetical protein
MVRFKVDMEEEWRAESWELELSNMFIGCRDDRDLHKFWQESLVFVLAPFACAQMIQQIELALPVTP